MAAKRKSGKPGRKPGRPEGSVGKVTLAVRELAQGHAEKAFKALAKIAEGGKDIPVAAQVAAIKEILDRAYGKSVQPVVGGDDESPPLRILTVEYVGGPKAKAGA